MKFLLPVFLYIIIPTIMLGQSSVNYVNFHVGDRQRSIPISKIDSITYSVSNNNTFIQNMWVKGNVYSDVIKNHGMAEIESFNLSYESYSDDNIINGIVNSKGDFCLVFKTEREDSAKFIVAGNYSYSDSCAYALVDSLGLIKAISANNHYYNVIYGEESIALICDTCEVVYIPYDVFASHNYSNHIGPRRVSSLTNNGVFKALEVLTTLCSYLSHPILEGLFQWGEYLGNGNRFIQGLHKLLLGFNITDLLKVTDYLLQYIVLGDAKVKTLGADKQSLQSYKLNCEVTIGKSKGLLNEAFPRSLILTMDVREDRDGGQKMEDSKSIPDQDECYSFSFGDLEVATGYFYQPKLEARFKLPKSAEYVSLKEFAIRDPFFMPFYMTQYSMGEEKWFKTETPSCSPGDYSDVTSNSATIEATYSNVPSGASCYLELTRLNGETIVFPNGSSDGTRSITVTGLWNCSVYTYRAYISYKGRRIESPTDSERAFETMPPDLQGTWNCEEEYDWRPFPGAEWQTKTRNYSITLNDDGSFKVNGLDYDYIGGSWGFSCDGSFFATAHIIATQTQNTWDRFEGKIENRDNPNKITGVKYRGNMNQVVNVEEVVGRITMTR